MPKNYYIEAEIILCAYAALYDENEFGGVDGVHQLTRRSPSFISMKIRNIAAKLEEEGIARNMRIKPLNGTAQGQGSRETNWEMIQPLTQLSQQSLQTQCRAIVAGATSRAA